MKRGIGGVPPNLGDVVTDAASGCWFAQDRAAESPGMYRTPEFVSGSCRFADIRSSLRIQVIGALLPDLRQAPLRSNQRLVAEGSSGYTVGIDTGTGIYRSGRLRSSDRRDHDIQNAVGAIEAGSGVDRCDWRLPNRDGDIASLVHGTTVGTNALIERTGARSLRHQRASRTRPTSSGSTARCSTTCAGRSRSRSSRAAASASGSRAAESDGARVEPARRGGEVGLCARIRDDGAEAVAICLPFLVRQAPSTRSA